MERYRDPLADASDDDLLRGLRNLPEQTQLFTAMQRTAWWEIFKDMDRYGWEDPEFLKRNRGKSAFLPIPLTQGFFMIVPKSKYRTMTTFPDGTKKKWGCKIDRDKETGEIVKVYGRRMGRKKYHEPHTVYAAREVVGMLDGKGDVDHVNGWGLDNRFFNKKHRVNLDYVSTRTNGSNALRYRKKNLDLLRGVERRGFNRKGQPLYGGSLRIRTGPKKVDCRRSKRKWLEQQSAHRWYLNQLKRRHRRESWAFIPSSVTYPTLPPLKPAVQLFSAPACVVLVATHTVVDDISATF